MKPIHYGLSFIFGRWPENSVRFWVESRMRFIDERRGAVEDYYQCASCKSEDTFAERQLFYTDNYDFTPVFGPEYGIVFRRNAYLNDNYKSCPPVASMWEGQTYKLHDPAYCRELEQDEDICEATREAFPLVAQTELHNAELGLRAIIEYPVKTMNIHPARKWYQTDTGPLLFMDLSARHDKTVDGISLAYAAFNKPHFADFVLEHPTPIVQDGKAVAEVRHYSRLVSLPAVNRLFAVK